MQNAGALNLVANLHPQSNPQKISEDWQRCGLSNPKAGKIRINTYFRRFRDLCFRFIRSLYPQSLGFCCLIRWLILCPRGPRLSCLGVLAGLPSPLDLQPGHPNSPGTVGHPIPYLRRNFGQTPKFAQSSGSPGGVIFTSHRESSAGRRGPVIGGGKLPMRSSTGPIIDRKVDPHYNKNVIIRNRAKNTLGGPLYMHV